LVDTILVILDWVDGFVVLDDFFSPNPPRRTGSPKSWASARWEV